MPDDDAKAPFFEIVEMARDIVAAMTGVKQQFVEAGWSEEAAEQMVVTMFKAGTKGKTDG